MRVCTGFAAVDGAAGFAGADWSDGVRAQSTIQQQMRRGDSDTGNILCIHYAWPGWFAGRVGLEEGTLRSSFSVIQNCTQ